MENIVEIDCSSIKDWDSFHNVFSQSMGFPSFYGRNMDAWIDCMSSLSEPEDGMSKIHCDKGSVVTLSLKNMKWLKQSCPEIHEALLECAAFVNYRLIEVGEPPVLVLSYES
ncbi:barstar family protein [Rheinheimera aquimaris]|uniref:barstar family protein n=1 Tax=Rheinheimera aquimaris TaxID=412437 RepID=UPI003A968F8E